MDKKFGAVITSADIEGVEVLEVDSESEGPDGDPAGSKKAGSESRPQHSSRSGRSKLSKRSSKGGSSKAKVRTKRFHAPRKAPLDTENEVSSSTSAFLASVFLIVLGIGHSRLLIIISISCAALKYDVWFLDHRNWLMRTVVLRLFANGYRFAALQARSLMPMPADHLRVLNSFIFRPQIFEVRLAEAMDRRRKRILLLDHLDYLAEVEARNGPFREDWHSWNPQRREVAELQQAIQEGIITYLVSAPHVD